MPNSNSSTSLYSFTNTVRVSANNFTTLYNATPSNVDVASVSDRNFTTLYNKQSEINPTRPYGNSNVEAFLNVGHDQGGNVVENINANGNISGNIVIARTEANLGLVGNVYIGGGGLNYFLTTDGAGGLSWTEPVDPIGNAVPFIHFLSNANANNQTFSNALLTAYTSNTVMNVMKNGVNIDPDLYEISGNVLTVNIPLVVGDSIDVLSTQTGSGAGNPGGTQYAVQINNGTSGFYGDVANFSFQPSANFGNQYTVTARHLSVIGNTVLGNNLSVVGNTVLSNSLSVTGNIIVDTSLTVNANTNLSNLSATGNVVLGNVANVHIDGGISNYFLQTDGLGNLAWALPNVGVASSLNAPIANVSIGGGSSNYFLQTDGLGNLAWALPNGGIASGLNAPIANVSIGGGSPNYFLQTDGLGNLTWALGGNGGGNGFSSNFYYAVANSQTTLYMDTNTGGGTPGTPSKIVFTDSNVGTGPTGDGTINGRYLTWTANIASYNYSPLNVMESNNPGGPYSIVLKGNIVVNNGYSSGTEFIHLGSVNKVYISGGSNGQVLRTDGANNLSWTSNIANANFAIAANTVLQNAQPNITSVGILASLSVSGNANVGNLSTSGSITGTNLTGTLTTAAQPNITSVGTLTSLSVSGNVNAGFINANGVGLTNITAANIVGTVANANYAAYAGNVTIAAQSNITSLGTLTNLSVTGNVAIQRAYEKFTPNATGSTGTVAFDVLDQSVLYKTANATANFTLNIRGNGSTTFDSILPANNTMTIAFLNTVGTTPYVVNTFQIDGNTIVPQYVGGVAPNGATRLVNCTQSYTYSIVKTAGNTFAVLGSLTEYK